MKKTFLLTGIFLSFFLLAQNLHAQNPYKLIEKIDFGSGISTYGGAITAAEGVVPYTYTSDGRGALNYNGCRFYYSRIKTARSMGHVNYIDASDHTGNGNGYMLIIGYYQPSSNYNLYTQTFTIPECLSDEKSRFTVYVANPVNKASANSAAWKPTVVKLSIKNESDVVLVTSSNTSLEYTTPTSELTWIPISLELPENQIPVSRKVKLVLSGIYDGAAWNEVLVDDVSFELQRKSDVIISSPEPGIYTEGSSIAVSANMSTTSLTPPLYYQWQSSADNKTFGNISSANGNINAKTDGVSYNIPSITSSNLPYYRLIYAESAGALSTGNYYKSNSIHPVCITPLDISGPLTVDRYTKVTYELAGNTILKPTWRVTGGCILSGQGTNSIEVAWTETVNTNLTVFLKTEGYSSTISLPTKNIVINDVVHPSISGSDHVDKMSTAEYSLENNNTGINPVWEVFGGRILSGQGTNTINVLWLHSSEVFLNTNVSVSFSNAICLSDLNTSLPVTVTGVPMIFSDETWYFGRYSGLVFKRDEYGNYTPTILPKSTAKTQTDENSLSVSNPFCNGENVFYASHDEVYNSSHQKFGNFSGNSSTADGLACCYAGQNKYALFSVSAAAAKGNLYYYIVDMSANSGKGSISAGTLVASGSNIGEGIELIAVPGTKNEYWLLYGYTSSNIFNIGIRKITANLDNGTITLGTATNTAFPSISDGSIPHHIVANQEGSVILFSLNGAGGASLCRFDPILGTLDATSHKKVYTGTNGYSAAFSPNGKFVYLSRIDVNAQTPVLYQIEFDAEQTPIASTSRTITMTKHSPVQGGMYSNNSQSPKLGPDNKIYINRSYNNPYISIIHTPDIAVGANGWNFEENAINVTSYLASNIYFGDEWSTGITSPSIALTGVNHEPVCPVVTATISSSSAPTAITTNVIEHVTDPDEGQNVYLTNATFDNPDETRGTISVNPSNGTVTYTPSGTFGPDDRILIRYKVKDDGLPGARCADGILSIGFGDHVPERSPIIFVSPTNNGTGEGTSWYNSCNQLQAAIDKAYLSTKDVDNYGFDYNGDGSLKVPYQVHIAKGVYKSGINFQTSGLVMKEGVNVFVEDNFITGSLASEVIIDGDLFLDQHAEASAWRYFGMPFTGNTDQIYDENGNKLSVNIPKGGDTEPQVLVEYYDVANRGLTAFSTGSEHSNNWKTVNVTPHANAGSVPYYSGNHLLRGYGYITVADMDHIRIKATNYGDKSAMFQTDDVFMPTVYFEHPDAANKSPWLKADYGWNLLCNPYSSYYRFDGTNHNFENPGNETQGGAAYSLIYWSEERAEYVALSRYDEAYLPPFKPIFFQVPDGTVTSFTFSNGTGDNSGYLTKGSGRLGGRSIIMEEWITNDINNDPVIIPGRNFRDASPAGTPVLRSTSGTPASEVIFLEISGEGYSDKTSVVINPHATRGYDLGWDLDRVVYANRSLPQIWTELEGHSFSSNELPASADGITRIPVHFYAGETATYRIGLGKTNRLSYWNRYYLQNTQTGETRSLNAGESFYIHASAGETAGNLVLIVENIFKSPTNINDVNTIAPEVYSQDRNIHIAGITEISIIEVHDISGRCIYHYSTEDPELSIPVSSAGVYMVSIKSSGINQIKKLAVNR